jgi:hypothetical protein
MTNNTQIIQTDRAARFWHGTARDPIQIGSEAHKRLFCRMLLETHDPYKPAIIDWPKLKDDERSRLVNLPIWNIAIQTEGRAKIHVMTYAEHIADPLLNEAIRLNGFEEGRHKEVLSNMVAAYGIKIAEEPPYLKPRDAEWAFLVTGYSECLDSFFAFGLFQLAKRSGFFPGELVDTFEPVMQEEGRHILFFVNWARWHRCNLAWWRKPWFVAKTLAVWVFLVWERIGIARSVGAGAADNNFTVTGSQSIGIEIGTRALMEICLAENERRLAGYDARLARPNVVPPLVRLVTRFLPRGTA